MRPGYYAQDVATERQSLMRNLIKNKQKASGLGGSFAGYGARGKASDIVGQGYKEDVNKIYQDVEGLKEGALSEFYSILDPYRDIG